MMEETRAPLRPSYIKGAWIGGFITAFAAVPLIGCCCFFWWPAGGAVAAWVASRPVYPFGAAEGFKAGLWAGILGAVLMSVMSVSQGVFDPARQDDFWSDSIAQLKEQSPEMYEQNKEFFDEMPERAKELYERPEALPMILGVLSLLTIGAAGLGGLGMGLWIRRRDDRNRALADRQPEIREPPVDRS